MGKRATAVKRTYRPLAPMKSVLLVEGSELVLISPAEVTSSRVGHKAVGLASIPDDWTTPFFVVCGDSRPTIECLSEALEKSGIRPCTKLLVRSSGVAESLDNRGELESADCNQAGLFDEISRLQNGTPPSAGTVVHWVVQELIPCVAKGHLSNERRIAKDKRDWIAEVEATSFQTADIHPIPLRTWRDDRPPREETLTCGHRESIVDRLRVVAHWAYARLLRLHFEWVWDGTVVRIVQADPCDATPQGVDPKSLVKAPPARSHTTLALEAFRPATAHDFDAYRKLANAKVYRELRYDIVPFFVLDNPIEIQSIVQHGRCSDALLRDLELLTTRPLVVRTDGKDTPEHLREMLPRSDELRSCRAAEQWLVEEFRRKVTSRTNGGSCLADTSLCLIAHHFVPAVASAWCQAHPNERKVRIESLWGIPEGLYWYAYDVFDVDTQVPYGVHIDARPPTFTIREKCRYKERFIAPNDDGAWVLHRTSAQADWARSITRAEWIHEIAWTSRCIAAREHQPVVVMWLIDTPSTATSHRVMPWFHMKWKQEGPIHKAAPRKKLAGTSEVVLQTRGDWQDLQRAIDGGKPVARIRVDPREPEMVRNQEFVKGLSALAKRYNIVIELSGGVLSHAYYMLSAAGCTVECVDLDDFAVDDEAIEFNKLVRDGIPEAITAKGESVALLRVHGEALVTALRRKLVEEAFEVLDARTTVQIAEELADVREVSLSIMSELGIGEAAVEAARRQKLKKRGGFKEGIMLANTAISSPLGTRVEQSAMLLAKAGTISPRSVTRSIELPSTAPEEIHVDLRHDSQGSAERQLTASLPAHAAGFIPPRVSFNLETQDRSSHEMVVEVEIERQSSDLRIRIRLKNAPQQLRLDIDC
jgi:predicted house-cleaning noncanonical NTP pyrophosphatase (MazG superfamily)